jgi:hypothetical protein
MSDSGPASNPKTQMTRSLIYQLAVCRKIERADEYPLEADGSQTISELCKTILLYPNHENGSSSGSTFLRGHLGSYQRVDFW